MHCHLSRWLPFLMLVAVLSLPGVVLAQHPRYAPPYVILVPQHARPAPRYGYGAPASYAYGWFGVPQRYHWSRHHGYYGIYTQWTGR